MEKNDKAKRMEELITAGKLLTHDVKSKLVSPSLAIFLIQEELKEEKVSADELLELLNLIETSCREIERIIINYEALLYKKGLEWREINEVFKEAVARFSELKRRSVKVTCKCKKVYFLSDSRLTPVFSNLIDNSRKYAENLSEIKLFCKEEKQGLVIIYSDNGKGVEKSEKEKIFQENYGEGTGRGLFLIRKTLKDYGCLIKEEGEFGKGAKFLISVPKERYKTSK